MTIARVIEDHDTLQGLLLVAMPDVFRGTWYWSTFWGHALSHNGFWGAFKSLPKRTSFSRTIFAIRGEQNRLLLNRSRKIVAPFPKDFSQATVLYRTTLWWPLSEAAKALGLHKGTPGLVWREQRRVFKPCMKHIASILHKDVRESY